MTDCHLFLPNLGHTARPCFGWVAKEKQTQLKPQALAYEMTWQGKGLTSNQPAADPGALVNTGEN